MANEGNGNLWDILSPYGTEDRDAGDDEIRDLRIGVGLRIDKEHLTLAGGVVDDTTTGGGEHAEGSAKAYYESAAPTNKPDGNTLGTADAGRLWVDSDDSDILFWNGSAWVNAQAFGGSIDTGDITNDAVDKDKIAADVAGNGLTQNVDGSLELYPDDLSIEISGDKAQLKDADGSTSGVMAEKLEPFAKTLHAVVWDEKTDTTDGGTFTSGAWRVRDLNQATVQHEDTGARTGGSWCSVGSNQITLAVGSYIVHGSAPAYMVTGHQALLYDTTGSANLVVGNSDTASVAHQITTRSSILGSFSLATQSVLEIRHRCETTNNSDGFGEAQSFGEVEIYTSMHIMRIGNA